MLKSNIYTLSKIQVIHKRVTQFDSQQLTPGPVTLRGTSTLPCEAMAHYHKLILATMYN
jgi:hypothetical protein